MSPTRADYRDRAAHAGNRNSAATIVVKAANSFTRNAPSRSDMSLPSRLAEFVSPWLHRGLLKDWFAKS